MLGYYEVLPRFLCRFYMVKARVSFILVYELEGITLKWAYKDLPRCATYTARVTMRPLSGTAPQSQLSIVVNMSKSRYFPFPARERVYGVYLRNTATQLIRVA